MDNNQQFNPQGQQPDPNQQYQQNPQAQQFQQQFNAAVQPPVPNMPVQQRSIGLCIVLSIITCGIYAIYWMYCLNEDAKMLSGDVNGTSGGIVILLSIVTCGIYELYWMYKQGERIDNAKVSRGMPSGNSGVLYLILSLVGLGIISYALMQNEINNIVRQ